MHKNYVFRRNCSKSFGAIHSLFQTRPLVYNASKTNFIVCIEMHFTRQEMKHKSGLNGSSFYCLARNSNILTRLKVTQLHGKNQQSIIKVWLDSVSGLHNPSILRTFSQSDNRFAPIDFSLLPFSFILDDYIKIIHLKHLCPETHAGFVFITNSYKTTSMAIFILPHV